MVVDIPAPAGDVPSEHIMKPLRPPYDRMVRGLPVTAPYHGPQLLG